MAIKIAYNFLKGLFSRFPSTYLNNNYISVNLYCKIIAYILGVEPAFYLQCNFRVSLESMFLLMLNLNGFRMQWAQFHFKLNWKGEKF